MTVKMGNLAFQWAQIREELEPKLLSTIRQGAFIGGAAVSEFEHAFSDYVGVQQVVGVANGTDAIEIALKALNLPRGSQVIVPANSFIATAEAVANMDLRPLLVDVDEFFQISLESFHSRFNKNVSAVVVVHLYGYPNPIDRLRDIVPMDGVKVLEDCAQAQGARLGTKHVGTLGDIGAFSFYPGKNLGAFGDAGAVVTDSLPVSELARRLGNHGRLGKFDHEILGRNSRLDALQAEVLRVKLNFLDSWNEIRVRNASIYDHRLSDLDGLVLPPKNTLGAVFHHYVVRVANRDNFRAYLLQNGIETGMHYPFSIAEYAPFEEQIRFTPNAVRDAASLVSLPVAEHLSSDDVEIVCDAIERYFKSTVR